jgi:hypothetical protein
MRDQKMIIGPSPISLMTIWGMPIEEIDDFRELQQRLHELQTFSKEYEWALHLSESTEHPLCLNDLERKQDGDSKGYPLVIDWETAQTAIEKKADPFLAYQRIAMRDSVMSLFHFGNVLETLLNEKEHCPTFRKYLNRRQLAVERKLFNTRFPYWRDSRQIVAHLGELRTNKKAIAANRADDQHDIGSEQVSGLSGPKMMHRRRTLLVPWQGRILVITLDQESLEKLKKTYTAVVSIFTTASAEFSKANPPVTRTSPPF